MDISSDKQQNPTWENMEKAVKSETLREISQSAGAV